MRDLLRLMMQEICYGSSPRASRQRSGSTERSSDGRTRYSVAQHTTELARAIMNDRRAAEVRIDERFNFAIFAGRHRALPVPTRFVQQAGSDWWPNVAMKIPTLDELGAAGGVARHCDGRAGW